LSTTHPKIDRPADAPRSRLDFAIHICEVDLTTGDALSPTVMLRESPTGIAEGSHLYRHGRYYYLLVAEGGTGVKHSECVYRSDQGVLGPWEPAPSNPILRSQGDDAVQNTGHVDLFEDARGKWWAVLLGVRPVRTSDDDWKASVFGMYDCARHICDK
jgi:beta-xylosidase